MVPEGFELHRRHGESHVLSAGVGEQYFDTLSIPLVQGTRISQTDDATDAPRVAIVNELIASRYWPVQDAVGRAVPPGRRGASDRGWTIVGVAKKSEVSASSPNHRTSSSTFPYRQRPPRPMTLIVHIGGRSHQPGDAAQGDHQDAGPESAGVQRADDGGVLPDSHGGTMLRRVLSSLIGVMGFMGLLLAIVGLYGLVAYAASRRTKEIGIRMAIGAGGAEVLRMVLRHGLVLAIAGLAVGLAAGAGAELLLEAAFPSGDNAFHPMAHVLVAPIVLAATLVAAYLPAAGRPARSDEGTPAGLVREGPMLRV